MWDFSPNQLLSVDEVFARIFAVRDSIEGITVLGGEPLDQCGEVCALLRRCRDAGLGTMVFTGYEMAELAAGSAAVVRELADILITGRYDQAKRTLDHQWIGSTNQEIHFLSGRYQQFQVDNANYVEITFEESGSLTILGFPDDAFRDEEF
jgi:anaerobic ribonucleoside-triphosphate reductase activating protein